MVGFQPEESLTHVGEGLERCDGGLAAYECGAEHGAGESGGHFWESWCLGKVSEMKGVGKTLVGEVVLIMGKACGNHVARKFYQPRGKTLWLPLSFILSPFDFYLLVNVVATVSYKQAGKLLAFY